MTMTRYIVTRKDDNNRPVFVEIFEYNGFSSDCLSQVITQYWHTKPMVINRENYYMTRIFATCNGPKIRMWV